MSTTHSQQPDLQVRDVPSLTTSLGTIHITHFNAFDESKQTAILALIDEAKHLQELFGERQQRYRHKASGRPRSATRSSTKPHRIANDLIRKEEQISSGKQDGNLPTYAGYPFHCPPSRIDPELACLEQDTSVTRSRTAPPANSAMYKKTFAAPTDAELKQAMGIAHHDEDELRRLHGLPTFADDVLSALGIAAGLSPQTPLAELRELHQLAKAAPPVSPPSSPTSSRPVLISLGTYDEAVLPSHATCKHIRRYYHVDATCLELTHDMNTKPYGKCLTWRLYLPADTDPETEERIAAYVKHGLARRAAKQRKQ